MNRYDSLRKQNKSRLGAAAVLVLCILLTGSMLFARLAVFTPADTRLYIPLTQSRGLTTVQENPKADRSAYHPANHLLLTANPGFRVEDQNTVWSGETNIEIFRISYQNGEGRVTVSSADSDKLLAPGTENTYEFALENTGNVPLEYTMDMQAYFSHEDYQIPVHVRLTDHQGSCLVGTREETVDVLALNGVSQSGTLATGYIQPYTLYWEWPFELDDEYDTMLGDLAVGEDITLTIVINTTASYTPASEPGGIPQTGDEGQIGLMAGLMIVSLAGLLFLGGKLKEEEGNV